MKINEIKCKTALSKSSLPGLDYSLNPYRGCQHKCAYCYVPNVLRIKREEWGNFVDAKTNIPVVLAKELKTKKPGVVGISTVTDPYQPIEKKYKLTRFCLEQLLIHDFPVCIQTKSDLIKRDIDLISKFSNAEVMVSLGTIKDSERKKLEPNTSSVDQRIDVLKGLSEIDVKTSVFLGPMYPSLTKENVEDLVNKLEEIQVDEIMIDKFNLKPGIWNNLKKYDLKNLEIIKNNHHQTELFNEIHSLCKNKKIKAKNAF